MKLKRLYEDVLKRINSQENYSRKYDCVMNPNDDNKGHTVKKMIEKIEGYYKKIEENPNDENFITNYEVAIRDLTRLLDDLGWEK